MNYYYEVKLNFLDKLYQFYEWFDEDKIMKISKIPIYLVNFKTFSDILSFKIKVTKEFLDSIKCKTKYKNGTINYTCIFTDENSSVALLFNSDGNVVFYSSLLPDDELNIREMSYKLKKYNLQYEKTNSLKLNDELRNDFMIKNYILGELKNMKNNNCIDKIKYIYEELFSNKEKNVDTMLTRIYFKLKTELDDNILNIYNILKLSHKSV